MILPYAKPINEKMREQLVKIWKKRKKMRVIFQHFQSMIRTQRKTTICLVGIKILNNSQNTAVFIQQP